MPITSFLFQTTNSRKSRERGRERERERERERDDLSPNASELENHNLAKDDLLGAIHPSHSRRASRTSARKWLKYYLNSLQTPGGNTK